MLKNSIIGILGAALAVNAVPWFRACTMEEKLGVFVGICCILIIFCFFCEEMGEKWHKYRARVKKIRSCVSKLQRGERKYGDAERAI